MFSHLGICLSLLSLLYMGWPGGVWANPVEGTLEDTYCFRCHAMKTLGYQDPKTGKHLDLYLDQKKFALADHGKQHCSTCHHGDFSKVPHAWTQKGAVHTCVDCHVKEKALKKRRMTGIQAQFSKSVHVQRNIAGFNCFSCHNPHAGKLEDRREPTKDVVQRDNAICLSCHEKLQPFAKSHPSIPKADFHMHAVRCLECHTPRPGSVIHAIEPAERAEKNCAVCHSRDSILLSKLYKYRLMESERRLGFVNGVVLNDVYIIGMTRNPLLDGLGIFAVLAALAGVLAHGAGRAWTTLRRKK